MQPVAVRSLTTKVTAPVPDPPLVVSESGVPHSPETEVTLSAAWVAEAKVTVVGDEEMAVKSVSAALVAVTMQVPTPVSVKVEPLMVQSVAVPLVAT